MCSKIADQCKSHKERLNHLAGVRARAARKRDHGETCAADREFISGRGLYLGWSEAQVCDDDGLPLHPGPLPVSALADLADAVRLLGVIHLDTYLAHSGDGFSSKTSLIPVVTQVLSAFPFVALKSKHAMRDIYLMDVENMPPSVYIDDLIHAQSQKKKSGEKCSQEKRSEETKARQRNSTAPMSEPLSANGALSCCC